MLVILLKFLYEKQNLTIYKATSAGADIPFAYSFCYYCSTVVEKSSSPPYKDTAYISSWYYTKYVLGYCLIINRASNTNFNTVNIRRHTVIILYP